MPVSETILPVLIGADMNCYTLARAFHEAYGVRSYAFGRWAMGDTMYSRLVRFTAVPDIDSADTLLRTVTDFAAAHADKTLIVMGCTDDYASLLMDVRDKLPANCIAPYITPELRDKLVSKADFYALCDKYGIPYPKTFCAEGPMDAAALSPEALGFAYPVIVKPSSSILYWKHPFDGMKKVYTAATPEEASAILAQIYGAGYPDIVILQDRIPGDDSFMHVLTAYCDKNNSVKMMCLGHVGLEEHTPKALGNHAAIITEYNEPLMTKLKAFLEDVGYTGFANFDIKYDSRDGSYRVFEINLRQGRSNYYVTGAGLNIARYVVEDRVLGSDLGPCVMNEKETFWHSVPRAVVYKYVKDPAFVEKARRLVREGRETTSFGCGYDLRWNPRRFAYYLVHMQRYFKKLQIELRSGRTAWERRLLYGTGIAQGVGHPRRAWPYGHCLFLRDAHAPYPGRARPRPHRRHHQQPRHHAGPHQLYSGPKRGEPLRHHGRGRGAACHVRRGCHRHPLQHRPLFLRQAQRDHPHPHPEHGGGDCAGREGGRQRPCGHPGHHRHGAHPHLPAHVRKARPALRRAGRCRAGCRDGRYLRRHQAGPARGHGRV